MKLQLGKTYRTRGGDIYKIDGVAPGAAYPFRSRVNEKGRPYIMWAENGRFSALWDNHNDDLIEEVTVSPTLTLEPGKYYRTRDGRKAYVAGISPFDCTIPGEMISGWIDGDGVTFSWHSDGKYRQSGNCVEDLVSEWRDPIKVAGYLNVYWQGSQVGLYDTREEADRYAGSGRIACIYVSGEEGVEP